MNKRIFAAAVLVACLSASSVHAQIFPRLFQPRAVATGCARPASAPRGLFGGHFYFGANAYRPMNAQTARTVNGSNTQTTSSVAESKPTTELSNATQALTKVGVATEEKNKVQLLGVGMSSTREVFEEENANVSSEVPEATTIEPVGVENAESSAVEENNEAPATEEKSDETTSTPVPNAGEQDALEAELERVNSIRAAYGIKTALRIDSRLQTGAQHHAGNMLRSGQVYHAPGCGFEICAQSFGKTIDGAIRQFLNSPAHRAILLQNGFRSCGIGFLNDQYGRSFVAIRFGY